MTLHFLSLYPDMKTPSSSQSNQQWVDTVVGVCVTMVIVMCAAIVCVLWGRRIYVQGHRRYWARVRREQFLASGAADRPSPSTPPHEYSETDAILWK